MSAALHHIEHLIRRSHGRRLRRFGLHIEDGVLWRLQSGIFVFEDEDPPTRQ